MSRVAPSPYALLRLLWRPLMLVMLFPLSWAVGWPLAGIVDAVGDPLAAMARADAPPLVRAALWQGVVLVSATVGLLVAIPRLELQHAEFSWTLPGLRQRLLGGTLLVALAVASGLAALVARSAPPAVVLAAFATSLLCFAAASLVIDVAMPAVVRGLVGLGVLYAAVRSAGLMQAAESAPMLMMLASIGLAIAALRVQFSASLARRRPFLFSGVVGLPNAHALRAYWSRSGSDRMWTRPLHSGRLVPWLHAATYETFGRLRIGYLGNRVAVVLVSLAFALVTQNPGMLMLIGITLAAGGIQLGGLPLYPLSRSRRADMAFAGTVVDAAVVCALAALLLPIVRAPILAWMPVLSDPSTPVSWPLALAVVFAAAPVAQWSVARGASFGRAHPRRAPTTLRYFIPATAYMLLVIVATNVIARGATGWSEGSLAAAVLAGAVLVHGVHRVALQRYYARADLVRSRG